MRANLLILLAMLATAWLGCLGAARAQAPPAATDEWYLLPAELKPGERFHDYLYVTEFGQGDTVVVLHGGWGAEHGYLRDALAGLTKQHHFVLYDQRGSLRSPVTSPAALQQLSVAQHVADLEQLRQQLKLRKMTLLAHSMGTFLALSYLHEHPDRVRGLVLLGAMSARNLPQAGLPDNDNFLSDAGRAFTERPAIAAEIKRQGLLDKPGLTNRERSYVWRIKFAGVNTYRVERWQQMKGGMAFYNSQAGSAAAATMPKHWDFTPDLQRHPYHCTVLQGDHDFLDMGGQGWRPVAASLPNVSLSVIKDAGHASWIDQPREVHRLLAAALRQSTEPLVRTVTKY